MTQTLKGIVNSIKCKIIWIQIDPNSSIREATLDDERILHLGRKEIAYDRSLEKSIYLNYLIVYDPNSDQKLSYFDDKFEEDSQLLDELIKRT